MSKMTVGQLRELLEDFDDETPVHIGYNYGDYTNTTVCPAIVSVENLELVYSSYHRMPTLKPDDPDEIATADEDKEANFAVVLSAVYY